MQLVIGHFVVRGVGVVIGGVVVGVVAGVGVVAEFAEFTCYLICHINILNRADPTMTTHDSVKCLLSQPHKENSAILSATLWKTLANLQSVFNQLISMRLGNSCRN